MTEKIPPKPQKVPTGDDLLWWNPENDSRRWDHERWTRSYICATCMVRWQANPQDLVRCWCCGKFQKRKYS